MQINTDQFRAIREQADEVAGLRRTFAYNENLLQEIETRAEARGFRRGWAAARGYSGRHARPRDGHLGQLRLVSGDRP
jgi:hypothetical protein